MNWTKIAHIIEYLAIIAIGAAFLALAVCQVYPQGDPMDTFALLVLYLIFNKPFPSRLDHYVGRTLAGEFFPPPKIDEMPGLKSIVTAWVNRNPELEDDVRQEILLMIRDKIDETIKELEK